MSLSHKLAFRGLTPPNKRPKRSTARKLRREVLEVRRLLTAEGDVLDLSSVVETAGLVGDVSAVVRWGDGTTSPASTRGGNATGNLRIRFDYSLDTGGFFSGAGASRRNLLQIAADSLIQRFGDDLAAITPGGIKEWEPSLFHPSIGAAGQLAGNLTPLPKNLPVAANEIIIYAGARDLPGASRGVGGPANVRFPATRLSCRTQAECDQKLAEIDAFRNAVRARGEAGALASPQTDVALHIGSVSFDTNTSWYFGVDAGGIQPGQVDFITVATHELAHVLGFGIVRTDVTTSWSNLTRSGSFTGPRARAAYAGSGNVPVESSHWATAVLDQAGQPTLLAAEVPTGQRQLPTSLDFAALDDLGWDLLDTRTTVTAQHRFPDDGVYAVDVVLRGSIAGEIVHRVSSVAVTNQAPTLTLELDHSSIHENDGPHAAALTIRRSGSPTGSDQTINLFSSDSSEATVPATVVIPGDATFVTAEVHAVDDALLDGDLAVTLSATASGVEPDDIDLIVRDHESLSASFSAAVIREDEPDSVNLTLRRSNTDTNQELEISVAGGNAQRLPLPPQVTIPAGQRQISIPLSAADNNDPGPALSLAYTFAASGYQQTRGEIGLLDDEPALFQNPSARFDVNNDSEVTAADALRVINQLATRGSNSQLDPQLEQPGGVFLDVSGDYRVSAIDALLVINEIRRMRDSLSAVGEALVPTSNVVMRKRTKRRPALFVFDQIGQR